ncbi:uncharacterized protein LOC115624505 [Scaptodrosophila lebanonensis]|uniref:Uncharacterized protein LOC115624505 n=1 Tax=Drosophila lebanonensis TaxID=7225 RepID=A0A6J2TGE8_DROLE|nr:uncharacterized protein LOC115624505 [Scaptodrosophila lebanonensis]
MKGDLDEASGSESENQETDEVSSGGENDSKEEFDLAASDSSSDPDSEEEDEVPEAKSVAAKISADQIRTKYEQLKGTRLYVRFPQKLPLDDKEFQLKAKALSPLIIKAHKPRQKHARFCLVEFGSKKDRDTALEAINTVIKADKAFKDILVSIPKTESEEFVKNLVDRKQKSLEKRKAKSLMKRATKKQLRKGTYTSSVVIINLPKTTSVAQLRKLFNNAVDIQIKPGKGKFRDFSAATVTLPSTYDARAVLKQDLSIAGTKLMLRFKTQYQKQEPKPLKRKLESTDTGKICVGKKLKALSENSVV